MAATQSEVSRTWSLPQRTSFAPDPAALLAERSATLISAAANTTSGLVHPLSHLQVQRLLERPLVPIAMGKTMLVFRLHRTPYVLKVLRDSGPADEYRFGKTVDSIAAATSLPSALTGLECVHLTSTDRLARELKVGQSRADADQSAFVIQRYVARSLVDVLSQAARRDASVMAFHKRPLVLAVTDAFLHFRFTLATHNFVDHSADPNVGWSERGDMSLVDTHSLARGGDAVATMLDDELHGRGLTSHDWFRQFANSAPRSALLFKWRVESVYRKALSQLGSLDGIHPERFGLSANSPMPSMGSNKSPDSAAGLI